MIVIVSFEMVEMSRRGVEWAS